MRRGLVIVESPAKAKTIRHLLPEFETIATKGHLRDLPEKRLGLNQSEGHYEGEWVFIPGQKKLMDEIKRRAQPYDHIYLAVDDDREGEAIAQQVAEYALKGKPYQRIVFHEITKSAIEEAIASHARGIAEDTVTAQHIRRYADRLIGYPMSNIIQYDFKMKGYGLRPKGIGKSISPSLHILHENHNRIENFSPENYYQIGLDYVSGGIPFRAMMKTRFMEAQKEAADDIMVDIRSSDHVVSKYRPKTKDVPPFPPLTTARLVRGAFYIFGLKPKSVMRLAQDLYEMGLITYMRTDSINLSDEAVYQIIELLRSKYPEQYYLDTRRVFKNQTKGKVQNAHEAIRPTSFEDWAFPTNIERFSAELAEEHIKLYSFIFYRTMATQMSNAVYDSSTVEISIGEKLKVSAEANHMIFEGWQKLNGAMLKESERNEEEDWKDRDVVLPPMSPNQIIDNVDLQLIRKSTKTPSRYGVGRFITEIESFTRPSTLDTIVDKLESDGYIEIKKGMIYITKLGIAVSNWTNEHASWLCNRENVKNLEEALDAIEEGLMENPDEVLNQYAVKIDALKQLLRYVERDYWPPSEAQVLTARGIAKRLGLAEENIEQIVATKKVCETFLDAHKIERQKIGSCPACKQKGESGIIFGYEKHYGCSNFSKTGCNFSLSKKRLYSSLDRWGVDADEGVLDEIVSRGLTTKPMLMHLRSQKGEYDAYIKIEKDVQWGWQFKLSFPRKKSKEVDNDASA